VAHLFAAGSAWPGERPAARVCAAGWRLERVSIDSARVILDGPDMETALRGRSERCVARSGCLRTAQRSAAPSAALVCAARSAILSINIVSLYTDKHSLHTDKLPPHTDKHPLS